MQSPVIFISHESCSGPGRTGKILELWGGAFRDKGEGGFELYLSSRDNPVQRSPVSEVLIENPIKLIVEIPGAGRRPEDRDTVFSRPGPVRCVWSDSGVLPVQELSHFLGQPQACWSETPVERSAFY